MEQTIIQVKDKEKAKLLAEIIRRIRAVSDPEQIILFGSYARNDFGPDSDLDVLVVKAGIDAPRQESVRIRRALRGLPVPIDVVVATPEQIERHRHTIGLIYEPALREGRVLYDRSAASFVFGSCQQGSMYDKISTNKGV